MLEGIERSSAGTILDSDRVSSSIEATVVRQDASRVPFVLDQLVKSIAVAGAFLPAAGYLVRAIHLSASGLADSSYAGAASISVLGLVGLSATVTGALSFLFIIAFVRYWLPADLALPVILRHFRGARGAVSRHEQAIADGRALSERLRGLRELADAADAGLEDPAVVVREIQLLRASVERALETTSEAGDEAEAALAALMAEFDALTRRYRWFSPMQRLFHRPLAPAGVLVLLLLPAFAVVFFLVVPFPSGPIAIAGGLAITFWAGRLAVREGRVNASVILPALVAVEIVSAVSVGLQPALLAPTDIDLNSGTSIRAMELGLSEGRLTLLTCSTSDDDRREVVQLSLSSVAAMRPEPRVPVGAPSIIDLLRGAELHLGLLPGC